jgi:NitT/TauT family transport system substrate-binding protein
MKKIHTLAIGALLAVALTGAAVAQTAAVAKKSFTFAWSHYVGWEPVGLMAKDGTLKKWADKEGITINVVDPMIYADSLTQYSGGSFDAVVVTNMDAIIGLNSVASEVIVVGDYSNGNDGAALRNGKSCADVKGRKVQLVEGSVSHYLLWRMMSECAKLPMSSVKIVDVSDENKIVAVYKGNKEVNAAVVTWNPFLVDVRNSAKTTMVYDSSKVPGEIVDMIVVRSDAPASFKRALTGAWYETIARLATSGPKRIQTVEFFAKAMGQTVPETEAQLTTTKLFYTGVEAASFTEAADMKRVTGLVLDFAKAAKLGKDIDKLGVKFPDGTVVGNPKNVRLTFTSEYMKSAK